MLACLLALKWLQSSPSYSVMDAHRTVIVSGKAGARIEDTYVLGGVGQPITIYVDFDQASSAPEPFAKGSHVLLVTKPPYDGATVPPSDIRAAK